MIRHSSLFHPKTTEAQHRLDSMNTEAALICGLVTWVGESVVRLPQQYILSAERMPVSPKNQISERERKEAP